MPRNDESEKLIGEIRNIQKELKALEENLQTLAEVLIPKKTLAQSTDTPERPRIKASNAKIKGIRKKVPENKRNLTKESTF